MTHSSHDSDPDLLFACYASYNARFLQAMANLPALKPWLEPDRAAIREQVRTCLGIEDRLYPVVSGVKGRTVRKPGYTVELLQAESWPGVRCCANLYKPSAPAGAPIPLVVLCCGHGAGGKLNPGYQAMAARLARQGAAVLVPDNIGQGERVAMGHHHPVTPFACGLTIQGLIVMETIAWLRWAKALPDIDNTRLAAIGNSGGGTLTLFLAALCPELAVLSSSGYPSTFEWIVRKEKKHCHCNLLPGIVGKLEMWQILSVFAPRPLFIFQGSEDHLFPEDLFYMVARQVGFAYAKAGAPDRFRFASIPGPHPWFNAKRYQLASFLAETLGLDPAEELSDDVLETLGPEETCYPIWPSDALTVDELAVRLSGRHPAPGLSLWDVYPPKCPLPDLPCPGLRGDHRQVFAQYEAFLGQSGDEPEPAF
ncbi:MAG: hypothetical protein GX821_11725 [Clostridiaceae bacterium]|nr:hypothetical protein [Clostridiaceae bacterium]